MNSVKLSLFLMLVFSGITTIHAVNIKNDTRKDIVIRIKDNHGVSTLVGKDKPIHIGEYSHYDAGYLFGNKDFPYKIRIWFAKDYVDPENREYSQLVDWMPTEQIIKDEAAIYALKKQGRDVADNNLLIFYDPEQDGFGVVARRSKTFQYGTPYKTEYANVPSGWRRSEYMHSPQSVKSSSEYVLSPSEAEYRRSISIGKQERTRTEYANIPSGVHIGMQRRSEYAHSPKEVKSSSEYVLSPSETQYRGSIGKQERTTTEHANMPK